MPPAVLRRSVVGPLWVAAAVAGAILSPLLVLLAGLASAVTGKRQPLLLVRFGLAYLVREMTVLIACGALWLASGLGRRMDAARFQHAHYRLLCWLLDGLLSEVLRALRLRVQFEPSEEVERALANRERPLIVLSRHAGPGDSVVMVHLLLTRFSREPRLVMKRTLALDPCIDLLCHRLPNALLDTSDREQCERDIAEIAAGMNGPSVLVLFPEGGNFTPQRRRRAIAALRREGRRRHARKAERMTHVMPPKPTGALVALSASPEADVIFAAHTGFGNDVFPLALWRNPPTDRTLRMRMWLAPRDRPTDPDEQVEWLYKWWKTLDDWIEHQGTEPAEDAA